MSGRRSALHAMRLTLNGDVGRAIRTTREAQGHSQNWLARECDSTQTSIARIESGDGTCSLFMLVAIADALDTTLDDLVPVSVSASED